MKCVHTRTHYADIAKYHYVTEDYTTCHRHLEQAKKHFTDAQPSLASPNPTDKDADKEADLVACGVCPSQRFMEFSLDTLDGFETACIGLSVLEHKQEDHPVANAIHAYLAGNVSPIKHLIEKTKVTKGSEAADTEPVIARDLTQQVVNRNADAFPEKAWQIKVADTVHGVAHGIVPRPSFWIEFAKRKENTALVANIFENCSTTLAAPSSSPSDAAEASFRLRGFARRVFARLGKGDAAQGVKDKYVHLFDNDAHETNSSEKATTEAAKLVHDMEAASEHMREQLSTAANRELEITSTMIPQTMIAILRHPETEYNANDVNSILLPKIRRLREIGPHGCRHALKLFDHVVPDSQAPHKVRLERIFTTISAAKTGMATTEMIAALNLDIKTIKTNDCSALSEIAAYAVNRGEWPLATFLSNAWSKSHESWAQCRDLGQFLGSFVNACTALSGRKAAASQLGHTGEPAVDDGGGGDAMDTHTSASETAHATNNQLTDIVSPLCRAVVRIIEAPYVQTGSKRKRDGADQANAFLWENLLIFIEKLKHTTALKTLVCALTVAYNRAQAQSMRDNRLSFSRYGSIAEPFFPLAETLVVHDPGSANTSQVFTIALQDVIRIAVKSDPHDDAYAFALADLYFALGDHLVAARYYLEAFAQVSMFYQQQVPQAFLKEKTIKRLVECLMNLNAHIQAAALCQYQRPPDRTTAFRAINLACGGTDVMLPASEVYFKFIWDTNMLEVLVQIHQSLGCPRKITLLRELIGRQPFNEATDARTRGRAIDESRLELLKALTNEFCSS